MFRAPKAIQQHAGVEEITSGDAEGSDYRYYVWLKDGWRFTSGRMAGCQGAFFQSVADFRYALPTCVARCKFDLGERVRVDGHTTTGVVIEFEGPRVYVLFDEPVDGERGAWLSENQLHVA
jgi:hypothetical protein